MGPENFFSSGMWIIPLAMMVVCVVLFRLGAFPGRSRTRNSAAGPTTESAVEILKKRYAKGEITEQELEAMRKNL